jgi:hypothetical protein
MNDTFTWEQLQKTIESLTPPLYYAMTDMVERGTIYVCKETKYAPEYIIVHPDNLATVKRNIPNRRLVPLQYEPVMDRYERLSKALSESNPIRPSEQMYL